MPILRKHTPRSIFRGSCIMLALMTIAATLIAQSQSTRAVSAPIGQKLIALTFDDGPYINITGRILDTLEKNSARATFFIVGSRVSGREEVIKRIEKLGCEIGNHTYSHCDLTRLSRARCIEEIELANKEFERVVGHGAELVRPPYGFYNNSVREYVPYTLVLWTVDTNDWKQRNAKELANYIVANAHDECIILMHDEQSSTAAALDEAIPKLIEMGYKFVTVSELIDMCGDRCTAIR